MSDDERSSPATTTALDSAAALRVAEAGDDEDRTYAIAREPATSCANLAPGLGR